MHEFAYVFLDYSYLLPCVHICHMDTELHHALIQYVTSGGSEMKTITI